MKDQRNTLDYSVEPDGSFVISQYHRATAFASFLPGIAGIWGKPLWTFYVNRGQGVCGSGIRDKDGAMSEFLPANAAYEQVFSNGFRTLLRLRREGKQIAYEPFQSDTSANTRQIMRIRPDSVGFEEHHRGLGLKIAVEYFTLPEEPIAALVRRVRLENTGKTPLKAQMVDGLATLIPFGLGDFMIKNMRYLAQSYTQVTGLEERVPCFRAKVSGDDEAVVEEVKAMHFCFGHRDHKPEQRLAPIVDPTVIFGTSTDPRHPAAFIKGERFELPREQSSENLLPCAFFHHTLTLAPGQSRSYTFYFGHVGGRSALDTFLETSATSDFPDRKFRRNSEIIAGIGEHSAMVSSSPELDYYARQNFLDNTLRGGLPVTIKNGKKPRVLHLYSRKHGDLERDYNPFVVEPTWMSQGDGNYRDVNQNRRHDVFANPDVGASTVRQFFNLIQADGYNPLIVCPRKLRCRAAKALDAHLARASGRRHVASLRAFVTHPFEPGRLFEYLEHEGMPLRVSNSDFLTGILDHASVVDESRHGTGYWGDHWTYNLDLLESFNGVFPDLYDALVFKDKTFFYTDSYVRVKPRSERYVLHQGSPMQLNSVAEDPEKRAMMERRKTVPSAMRTKGGKGPIFRTTLASKLLSLATIKLATLDPSGMGMELEAERPNWYDALNGLPALFGSSLSETFELKRLLLLLSDLLDRSPDDFEWQLPIETHDLLAELSRLLSAGRTSSDFAFWDAATTAKERFRERIRFGFDGGTRTVTHDELGTFLKDALRKVERGIRRGVDRKTGLYHTYFRYDVTNFSRIPRRNGDITIRARAFKRHALPHFLEGQVHALRTEQNAARRKKLIEAVRKSDLYDSKLGMFKVNASLKSEPASIGRARSFASGWLENESIWLHMEYKYLLEILRGGNPSEFFKLFKRAGIPFLDPRTYGRSPLENSSFIVSSAYPRATLAGKGFMARLSGASAEFIHIWMIMCFGENIFSSGQDGSLSASLRPVLPGWLFTNKRQDLCLSDREGTPRTHSVPARSFAATLLGHTAVIYRQKGTPRDTFGSAGARVRKMNLVFNDGRVADVDGDTLGGEHAVSLRAREIAEITAWLS